MTTYSFVPSEFEDKKFKCIDLHPVIQNRPFTPHLPKGYENPAYILTPDQMKYSIIQWLAFSSEFIEIQAMHLVRAPTKAMRKMARNILVNELGVPITHETGNAEGHRFSHYLAHVEWMEEMAELLEIDTTLLDYWQRANEKTKEFLAILRETYGSRDWSVSAGASFALERLGEYGLPQNGKIGNIPNASLGKNFWSEELAGLELFNQTHRLPFGLIPLPHKFFAYHKKFESSHMVNANKELDNILAQQWFNEEQWLFGAKKTLDGVYLFFEGREEYKNNSEY